MHVTTRSSQKQHHLVSIRTVHLCHLLNKRTKYGFTPLSPVRVITWHMMILHIQAIVSTVLFDDLKISKGRDLLKLYQFNTKTAKHYFCSICGIYTHHQRRSNPKEFSFNTACIEGFKAEDHADPHLIDGINHIKDTKEQ